MTKSLVLELQKELLDNTAPLSQLAIKAWTVAKKLKLEDDAAQFRREFDGYSDYEDVPNYRQIKGTLQKYQLSQWKNVSENGICIYSTSFYHNKPITDFTFPVRKPIRTLEKELNVIGDVAETIRPFSLQFRLKKAIYIHDNDKYRCAYSPTVHSDILHEIKINLIEWTMSLSENGILGNGMSFEEDEKEMAKQIIHAGGNVILQNNPNNSPQNVTFNTNQLEVFDKLLDAVNIIENNEQIVESIEDMKKSISRQDGSFKSTYNKFMECAADHMTVLLPFIQELTKFF